MIGHLFVHVSKHIAWECRCTAAFPWKQATARNILTYCKQTNSYRIQLSFNYFRSVFKVTVCCIHVDVSHLSDVACLVKTVRYLNPFIKLKLIELSNYMYTKNFGIKIRRHVFVILTFKLATVQI